MPYPMVTIAIVELAVDSHRCHLSVVIVVKDKPCLVTDLVTDTVTVHATADTLTSADKASDNAVDMNPEEPLIPAPA